MQGRIAYAQPNDPEGGKKFCLVSSFLSLRDPCRDYAIRRHYLSIAFFSLVSSFLPLMEEKKAKEDQGGCGRQRIWPGT